MGEAAAFDELQRQERPSVLLAHVVDLDDVGMLQPRDCLGLGVEAGDLGRAGVAAGQDHLERHLAIEADVPRPVDHAHPAATELLHDLVPGHDRTRAGRGRFAVPGRPPAGRIRSGQIQEPTRLEAPDEHRTGRPAPRQRPGTAARILPLRSFTQLLANRTSPYTSSSARSESASSRGFWSEEILDRNPVARPIQRRRRSSARNSPTSFGQRAVPRSSAAVHLYGQVRDGWCS